MYDIYPLITPNKINAIMKRHVLKIGILSLFLTLPFIGMAQTNPSFEDWTENTFYQEPVGYATFNAQTYFATGQPNVTKVQGNSGAAMRLETVAVGNDTIMGFASSARGGFFSGGAPFKGKPDSVRITCRYSTAGMDSASIIFIFKALGVPQINIITVAGNEPAFTELTYPLNIFFPSDTLIAVMTSSNISSDPVAGSWIEIDKIEFLVAQTDTMVNGDFNRWFDVKTEEPDGWYTVNLLGAVTGGPHPPKPVQKTNDATDGNLACKIISTELDIFGFKDTVGALANAPIFFDGGMGGVPFTAKPTKMKFDYKYEPMGNDSAGAMIRFADSNGDSIAGGLVLFPAAATYTEGSIDIDWTGKDAPDSMLIAFSATGLDHPIPGSVFIIDHIVFEYSTGIEAPAPGFGNGISLYPNPAGDVLHFQLDEALQGEATLRIFDMIGRVVAERNLNGESRIDLNLTQLQSGQYLYELRKGDEVFSGKFAKH